MPFSKFRMLSISCEHCEKLFLLNCMQCSGSGLDPDFNRSLEPNSRSRQAKITHKQRKSKEIPWFVVLGVLFGGLEVSSELGRPPWRPKNKLLQFWINKVLFSFQLIFLQFLVI
jgi:hypothetical protein